MEPESSRKISYAYNKFSSSYLHLNKLPENNYEFANEDLDIAWSHHPSYKPNKEFQRLEFLGDKLILSEISKLLFHENPTYTEGDLTMKLSEIVKGHTMSQIGTFLIAKIKHKGDLNSSIICDCLEAWIAAIYLDGGDIQPIIKDLWADVLDKEIVINPKNELQELLQSRKLDFTYNFEETEDNFKCLLNTGEEEIIAFGTSKKEASIKAAQKALDMLKNSINPSTLE